ncbi:MAG TPA: type II toxin-antitoxin system VapC family toxin [Bryobacteraceae bacterium]|nr:type II toxin-antitoxin system VapC family toxin [Bryobacteraceae bacterium]
MIVLDTNVVSEVMNPKPSAQVLSWMASCPQELLCITTITEAEILYGVELLPAGKRRAALQADIESMLKVEFAGRILPFDEQAARAFSRLAARRRSSGRPIGDLDAQIAAIAFSRGASVATRDVRDFEDCGVEVLNPWAGVQL